MAASRRSEPLRAGAPEERSTREDRAPDAPLTDLPSPDDQDAPSTVWSTALGIGVGLAMAVAGVAIAFSIVAIPLFIVASTEPSSGLDRDLVRTGLFKVALPFGVVTGVVAGVAVGVWYARGGRLPRDRTPLEL